MQETILSTLREEHQEVDTLMDQIQACKDPSKKQELFSDLIESLVPHMEGEEKTLYSKLHNETQDEDAVELSEHADEEHQEVKRLLTDLDALDIESAEWDEKFQLLKESIQHHVEEEESELFAEAKEDFTEDELVEIGEEFEEAKQQLQQ